MISDYTLYHNFLLQYLHKKEQLTIGDLSLYCVHPEKNFCADSANAYSTTLSLQWKKYSILLTGDLEKNGEEVCWSEDTAFLVQNGFIECI
mgnify:CR=1 FL=1